jgi:hypothetical protein
MLTVANSLLSGKERDAVKNELAGDMEFLFAGICPDEFEKFEDLLRTVIGTDYQSDQQCVYQQDLLDLFVEYKLITTKYFKNDK